MKDKVAVVTGGGSGIGLATAQLFAEEGAQVVIFDIDASRADETWIHSMELTPAVVDVTSAAASGICDQRGSLTHYGRLDILVNVAGGSGRKWGDGPTDSCTLEGWDKTLRIESEQCFLLLQICFASHARHRDAVVIVNVSSVLGMVGGDDDFATHAYASSKGAVISLTRSIASYYAPRGIRANVICPGLIATPMSQRAQESEHIRSRLSQLQPLTGDFGSPRRCCTGRPVSCIG